MGTVTNVPIVGDNFSFYARLQVIDDFARQLADYHSKILGELESEVARLKARAVDDYTELVRRIGAYTFGGPYILGSLPLLAPLNPLPERINLTRISKSSVLMWNMRGVRMVLCVKGSLVGELFACVDFPNAALLFVKYLERSIGHLFSPQTHSTSK